MYFLKPQWSTINKHLIQVGWQNSSLQLKICTSTLKTEAKFSSETLLTLYQDYTCHIPEVSILLVLMFRVMLEGCCRSECSDTPCPSKFRFTSSTDYHNTQHEDASTPEVSHLLLSAAVCNDYIAGRTRYSPFVTSLYCSDSSGTRLRRKGVPHEDDPLRI
jgi:hypothetical protein